MLPEQQQRILGYFIEEAKDHLNTIEQGLLNLSDTLADPEMVNEIFRAAHSIKGGAAMLGLSSIQRTAHGLEDYFKLLKECPTIQINQNLESLFLRVFDTLQALLDRLEASELTEDVAQHLMSEVEPVFAAIEQQLEVQGHQTGDTEENKEENSLLGCPHPSPWLPVFENSVPEKLRQLLQLFKQPETSQSRYELKEICNQLAQLGEQYNLSGWCTLCETAAGAIASEDNTYRILAPIIIKELKQAQALVMASCAEQITTCEQLQALSIATFLFDDEETSTNRKPEATERFTINYIADEAEFLTSNLNELNREAQFDALTAEDDLSSLFVFQPSNSNQFSQEPSELSNFLNINNDLESSQVQELRENLTSISYEETLALNNLFDETQDASPSSLNGESGLYNLFTAEADSESFNFLELPDTTSTVNADLGRFWLEEPDAPTQIQFEVDSVLSNSSELEQTLEEPLIEPDLDWATIAEVMDTTATDFDLTLDPTTSDFFAPAQLEEQPSFSLFETTADVGKPSTELFEPTADVDEFNFSLFEQVPVATDYEDAFDFVATTDAAEDFFAPAQLENEAIAATTDAAEDFFAPAQLEDEASINLFETTADVGEPSTELFEPTVDDDESNFSLFEQLPVAADDKDAIDFIASIDAAVEDSLATASLESESSFNLLQESAATEAEEDVIPLLTGEDSVANLVSDSVVQEETLITIGVVDEVDEFAELEALLEDESTSNVLPSTASVVPVTKAVAVTESINDEFSDLEQLLEEPSTKTVSATPVKPQHKQAATTSSRRSSAFEQMMRVPVKHLDNIGNLVGELVIYRNSLEQDQERQRQFLDNLLHQVQQLSDVGSRMQELYERSLLEASLLSSRQGGRSLLVPSDNSTSSQRRHATGINFDALEMDRFTGFHTLAQEMIELIVRVREASSDIEFVTGETEQVARQFRQVTTHLQEGITRSRMVPFSQIADRLPRAVRDISLKYGKQAELQIEGQDTLIDKVILEQLYDPMTHLVNNAITHGIESPEERSAKGKSPLGQITVRAFYQGNQTVIAVSDDGAGIDPERVKAKAINKGLITPEAANNMSRLDVYNLLFHPGFSTKEQVDEFAGRGVGMDVVLTSLTQMRGTITTDSTLGKGTTFTIRLPLTLSICKALCCLSDKARIAFPMDGVDQMFDISVDSVVANAEGQACIPWRNSLLPFRHLKELLAFNRQIGRGSIYGSTRDDGMISIVVLRSAETFIALQVDQVLSEQEIVIKQFESSAPKPVGVAGATILGDGRIVPIADVLELIELSMGRIQQNVTATSWAANDTSLPPETPSTVKTEPLVLIIDDSITVRELLSMTFTNAGYRVEQARDGQEAWDKLRDGLPCELVFCDIEMPRMDGLELLSRMQKDTRLSQLPIAMLTSRGSDRHRQMALQLGASGYFTKPYLEEALLDGAQRMLRGEVLLASSSNA